uniref:ATP synthase delta chain, chloroplastic n=1 Tax=Tanacetum cinerariifolium TaxID=118510 RepID=A0A6L2LDP3_TANCI|nr:ATP synthase delta chain, chloroplastic [Tanacetum cinerariifolium]
MDAISTTVPSINLPKPHPKTTLHHHLKPPILHHFTTTTKPSSLSSTKPTTHKHISHLPQPSTPPPLKTHRHPTTGYAAALLDHAICTNSLEAVHKDVKKVLKWLKCNEMLKSVMGDANVGESVKGMVIKEVVEKGKMRKQVVALVKMLVAKSKSGMVVGVMEEFERIYWELNNSTRRPVSQI